MQLVFDISLPLSSQFYSMFSLDSLYAVLSHIPAQWFRQLYRCFGLG